MNLNEKGRVRDWIDVTVDSERDALSRVGIMGHGFYELFDEDGNLKQRGEFSNLVTEVGDEYYGERAAGIASPPNQVSGMKLGTGATAVAKTGAGAGLVTYLTNSHQAIDGGFPTSALQGSSRRIQWKATFAAAKATGNSISEAVLVVDALADATSTPANTICRALLSPVVNKGASDTLAITWNHDLLGA